MTNTKPSSPSRSTIKSMSKMELIARVKSLPCAPDFNAVNCPAERLKQELGTHQIELEAQNQALRESQSQTAEMLSRYSDLYDFAPVGYLTLDQQGLVQELNITGAGLLGSSRQEILATPLSHWLAADSGHILLEHLNRVFQSTEQVVDDVRLRREDDVQRHLSLVSVAIKRSNDRPHACRSVLVDISNLKQKEAELTLSHQQMRNLSAHLDQVREDERKHMAREIHDELGQKLATLRFDVAMLGKGPQAMAVDKKQITTSLLEQIDEVIESMRAIASDLRPAVLDLGLAAAIEWQVQEISRRTGMTCKLKNCNEDIPLDNDRATAVFRVVQESLTNIIRHAQASKIDVKVVRRTDSLNLQIADNGIGIPDHALHKTRTFGIAGMRERVRLLDGTLDIKSRTGHGTTIAISIPLNERRIQKGNRNPAWA